MSIFQLNRMKNKLNRRVKILMVLIKRLGILPGLIHVLNCIVTILRRMIFKRWRYSLLSVENEM